MASVALSLRVGRVVAYPPLSEMSDQQRREFHEALLEAAAFEGSAPQVPPPGPRTWQEAARELGEWAKAQA
jgi:hypothetical protein